MTRDRHPPLLVAWTLVVVVALSWGLGSYPLMDQDEGRNAEVAREMAASGDYVLPRLNGLPYVDKPVLFFAAAAAVMELLGPTELAARAVPLLAALATVFLVGWHGARWYGREAGWVAAVAAATAPLPLAFSRIVILDSLLALTVTAALLAFHAAVEARRARRSSRLWTVAAWTAVGLGILVKGPVALAVPLLVAAPYAAWRRASRAVWDPWGLLAMAAIVGPWVWFMEARLPGYLHYVAVTETWQRVASDELQRTQPWWYFLAIAGAGFFPWWLLALGRQRLRARGADPRRVFLLLWLLVPLVFFSLSRSKLPQYILPLMPAVALLVASRWGGLDRVPRRAPVVAAAGWLVLGAVMAAAVSGALAAGRISPALYETMKAPATVLAGVCLAAAIAIVAAVKAQRGPAMVAALSLPLAAIPVVLHPVIDTLAHQRSERDLVELILTELPAETEVLGIRAWRPSVSFYLQRPIPIASPDGMELRSNFIQRTYDRWVEPDGLLRPAVDPAGSFSRCDQPRVFLVHSLEPELIKAMRSDDLEEVWSGPKLRAFFCDPLNAPPTRDAETENGEGLQTQ